MFTSLPNGSRSGDVVEIQLWLGQLELHEDGIGVAIPNQINSRVQE